MNYQVSFERWMSASFSGVALPETVRAALLGAYLHGADEAARRVETLCEDGDGFRDRRHFGDGPNLGGRAVKRRLPDETAAEVEMRRRVLVDAAHLVRPDGIRRYKE